MAKHIHLDIPEPCHEKWDRMTPSEQGRFCASCCKQVIDFTNMSDSQLASFFKKPSTGSVCGRFMQDQLNRDIEIPRKRIPWIKYFFQFALPAFLMSAKATAQGGVMIHGKDTTEVMPVIQDSISLPSDRKESTTGQVIDEYNNPVPYASILVKGTSLGTEADSTGLFTIKDEWIKQRLILEISSAGFLEQEVKLSRLKTKENITIQLKIASEMKEVVVVAYGGVVRRITTTGLVSTIMGSTRNVDSVKVEDKEAGFLSGKPLVSIYPNPARKGSAVTINIKRKTEGLIQMRVLDLTGQLLLSKHKQLIKGDNMISFRVDERWPAGVYVIQLIDREGKLVKAEKMVVQ